MVVFIHIIMFKYLPIFFILLCVSCNNTNENSQVTYIIESPSKELVAIDSVVSNIKLTELELTPQSLMSGITTFSIAKERIYCFSNAGNGVVKVFNLYDGKYLFKIDHAGRANNEWIELSSMFINEKDNLILLTDRMTSKVLMYDLEGEFIKSITLQNKEKDKALFREVVYMDGLFFAVTTPIYTNYEIKGYSKYKINIFDKDGNFVKEEIPTKYNDSPFALDFINQIHLTEEGHLLLAATNDNIVYRLDEQVRPYIKFNNKGNIPFITDDIIEKKAKNREPEYGRKYTFFSNRVLESNNIIYRRMGYYDCQDILYNKHKGKVVYTSFYSLKQVEGASLSPNIIYPAPYVCRNGRFYSVIDVQLLGMPDGYIRNNLPESLKDYRSKYLKNQLNQLIVSYEINI